jgi:hypothetical protein
MSVKFNNKNQMVKRAFGLVIIFSIAAVFGCAPTLSDRDLQCRQLVRDGQEAKTQAEYDYAKQKFVQQCNGWKDPDDRK